MTNPTFRLTQLPQTRQEQSARTCVSKQTPPHASYVYVISLSQAWQNELDELRDIAVEQWPQDPSGEADASRDVVSQGPLRGLVERLIQGDPLLGTSA